MDEFTILDDKFKDLKPMNSLFWLIIGYKLEGYGIRNLPLLSAVNVLSFNIKSIASI